MKKEKIIMAITIGLCCFILVMVMFMQFKVVNETDITSIETMTESELRSELVNWREKYEKLSSQHSDTLVKIKEYKEEYKTDEETQVLLEKELKESKQLLGTESVIGKGIIINVDDRELKSDSINYEDLLFIINSLKSAGAEAISINGNRIIMNTDIVNIKDTIIKVNGNYISSPYSIKAIGNQTYLESALVGSGRYLDELQKFGFKVEITRSDSVEVEAYNEAITNKYINN